MTLVISTLFPLNANAIATKSDAGFRQALGDLLNSSSILLATTRCSFVPPTEMGSDSSFEARTHHRRTSLDGVARVAPAPLFGVPPTSDWQPQLSVNFAAHSWPAAKDIGVAASSLEAYHLDCEITLPGTSPLSLSRLPHTLEKTVSVRVEDETAISFFFTRHC